MMFEPAQIYPKLIEPGVKYFLEKSLENAHIFKIEFQNYILNISLFVVFCLVLVLFLSYRYKGKLSPEEKEQQAHQSHQYVLQRIKNYEIAKRTEEQELITGLPHWNDNF
jgi:hypothetical protein